MEFELGGLLVVVLLVGVVAWIVSQGNNNRRGREIQAAAIESDAVRHYYQQALRMARVLDRIERDEMISVTIPADLRAQIRTMVETFFEEGEDPRSLPR